MPSYSKSCSYVNYLTFKCVIRDHLRLPKLRVSSNNDLVIYRDNLVTFRNTSHLDKYFRIIWSLSTHTCASTYTSHVVPSSKSLQSQKIYSFPVSVPSSTLIHPQLRSIAVTIAMLLLLLVDRNVVWADR